jgi:hypothetical protein
MMNFSFFIGQKPVGNDGAQFKLGGEPMNPVDTRQQKK